MEYKYPPIIKYIVFFVIIYLFLKYNKEITPAEYLPVAILFSLILIILDYMLISNHQNLLNSSPQKKEDFNINNYSKVDFNSDDENDPVISRNCKKSNYVTQENVDDPNETYINKKYSKYNDPNIKYSTIKYSKAMQKSPTNMNLDPSIRDPELVNNYHDELDKNFGELEYDDYDQYNMRNTSISHNKYFDSPLKNPPYPHGQQDVFAPSVDYS